MKLITILTIACILTSALEKLVTYISMRMFPYRVGEYNLLALQIFNIFGLELGTLFLFVANVIIFVVMKKVAEVLPKYKKAVAAALIFLIAVYTYILISNLWLFIHL